MTHIYGLIGFPIKHSVSPAMHQAAFQHLGIDATYLAFPVKSEKLAVAIAGAKALGIKGLNVTIPHKERVIRFIDKTTPEVDLIGAVNTVKIIDDKSEGYNTDGKGAVEALKEETKVSNKTAVLLGAGGAARAISFQLALENVAKITIANRTVDRAERLVEALIEETGVKAEAIDLSKNKLIKKISVSDILINATPVGMTPNTGHTLVTADMLHPDLVVNDIVYNPLQTRLLKEAEKAGAKTISGIGMLVYQGTLSFEIWTGQKPPIQIMRKAALNTLREVT